MPDPKGLKIGDRVRFVDLPEEWKRPGVGVPTSSATFLKILIARGRPCRIARVDEDGFPWIEARTRRRDGRVIHHSWCIFESSGWRKVERRSPTESDAKRRPAGGRGRN